MKASEKLAQLGHTLPEVAAPVGNYVPAIVIGDMALTSGQIPMSAGKLMCCGKVGESVTLEQAQDAAKLCALNALAESTTSSTSCACASLSPARLVLSISRKSPTPPVT